jgi:hypothetical protein
MQRINNIGNTKIGKIVKESGAAAQSCRLLPTNDT